MDIYDRIGHIQTVVQPALREQNTDDAWDYHTVLNARIMVEVHKHVNSIYPEGDMSINSLTDYLSRRIETMQTSEFAYGLEYDQIY